MKRFNRKLASHNLQGVRFLTDSSFLGINKHRLLPVFLFSLAIFFYCLLVSPVIKGGFVLDDWPNLSGLSSIGKTRGTWSYVFDGTSSILGRQISYISFALQSSYWPDNPAPFKIVNIAIHALNASLLFCLFYSISILLGKSSSLAVKLSFIVAIIWLFLPIHASTVFYVIQRMAILSATFTLLALLAFVYSCLLYKSHRYCLSAIALTFGMGSGYLFGILSKENAILLGVYALTIYYLIRPSTLNFHKFWKAGFLCCCLIPIFALIVYLLIDRRYLHGYGIREFDLYQRLLTEPVILWDYLRKIIAPSSYALNLYNDGFPIAKSLLGPPYSGVAIVAWFVVLISAYVFRKVAPYFLFGITWFIGGHLLESTVIGLELYFEHRNYMPSIGLVVGAVFSGHQLICWLEGKFNSARNSIERMVLVGLCGYIAWQSIVLQVESETWGDPQKFAMASLAERPQSLRAYQDAAAYFANSQEFITAYSLLDEIDRKWYPFAGTMAQKLLVHCFAPEIYQPTTREILKRFESSKFDFGVPDTLNEILKAKRNGSCATISWEQYRAWVSALYSNPQMKEHQQNAVVLLAYSYNAEEKFIEAADALNILDSNNKDIGFLLLKTRFTAMAGKYIEALAIVDEIRKIYSSDKKIWLAHKDIIENLDSSIRDQIDSN